MCVFPKVYLSKNPKSVFEPFFRKQIFAPMSRDKDGHYVVDGSFISG